MRFTLGTKVFEADSEDEIYDQILEYEIECGMRGKKIILSQIEPPVLELLERYAKRHSGDRK